MQILVVGGAGYIGSITVEQLLNSGYDVVVADNLSRGHRAAVDSRAKLEIGDIGDAMFVDYVFKEHPVDAVMHFAAHSLVGESVVDPIPYYVNNIASGALLLKGMIQNDVKRFIFSSTAALFGTPESLPIREDDTRIPTNPYGRTKLFFESLLGDCRVAHGLQSVCLRYFNAAGASEKYGEDHSPESHLIPLMLQAAAGKRPHISVFGKDYPTRDGTCVRDYIHVIDLAQAHILALEHLTKTGVSDCFNLGNGEGFTVLEVIEAAERVTGKSIKREMVERRSGDPASLIASSEKIRGQLGWKPKFPTLESIIASAWNWYSVHPEGYED